MGLALDSVNGKLFWVERDSERVMSLSLSEPSTPTAIAQLPVGAGLRGMAIAESIGKIYWAAENLQTIQRANVDGTNLETLPIAAGSFFDVQVDDQAGKLYWTDGSQIWKGNLDGTSAAAIISNTDQPYYLALDLEAGKIYWTDFSRNEIGRANLDGTGREDPGPISGLLDRPVGIILDKQAGKVYWTLEGGTLLRANLDGTNSEVVHSGLQSPWDITLVASIPVAGIIPAASTWSLIALSICLLCAGTILVFRRQCPPAAV